MLSPLCTNFILFQSHIEFSVPPVRTCTKLHSHQVYGANAWAFFSTLGHKNNACLGLYLTTDPGVETAQ